MRLSKLKQPRPTETVVEFPDGDRVTLVYDRAQLTGDILGRGSTRISRLSHLLVSWDVTNDDGTPYQPPEGLNGEAPAAWVQLLTPLPQDVLRAIEDAIWDDFNGGKAPGGDSTAT